MPFNWQLQLSYIMPTWFSHYKPWKLMCLLSHKGNVTQTHPLQRQLSDSIVWPFLAVNFWQSYGCPQLTGTETILIVRWRTYCSVYCDNLSKESYTYKFTQTDCCEWPSDSSDFDVCSIYKKKCTLKYIKQYARLFEQILVSKLIPCNHDSP